MLTLWGSPHSYYTGKVRSYLIKKGLPYRELLPTHPRFYQEIIPKVGHLVVPIVETEDGSLFQDSADIINELERRYPEPAVVPSTPVQRVVASLLEVYGSEGLLAPGMHYRWSYRAEQEHFLRTEFGRLAHHGPDRKDRLLAGEQLMDYFNNFLPSLGVYEESIPAIEAAYLELLDALDIHFQTFPYLLGGLPSVADFGFMAPLYAHLGRDPVPASLMKNRAPNVYRWTERMNHPSNFDGEFFDLAEDWLADDQIPETLHPVLRLLFRDWGAQLLADEQFVNAWLESNADLPAGTMVSEEGDRKVHPTIGPVEYSWRGVSINRASQPHGLWRFEQVAAMARALQGDAGRRFGDLIGSVDGNRLMQIELARPMTRQNYVLVLA
jgi:glutathione S-transferase